MAANINALTDRQRSLWQYMLEYQRDNAKLVSIRQMCAHLGISSPNGVTSHLKSLVAKGYVIKIDSNGGESRSSYQAVMSQKLGRISCEAEGPGVKVLLDNVPVYLVAEEAMTLANRIKEVLS